MVSHLNTVAKLLIEHIIIDVIKYHNYHHHPLLRKSAADITHTTHKNTT